jgi:hypothetical protein
MASKAFLSGSCHCGNVAVEASILPRLVSLCHCRSCRKITGSFGLHAFFKENDVQVSGILVSYEYPGGSGNSMSSSFCAKCFTRVKVEPRRMQGVSFVPVGIFDETALGPEVEIWKSEALSMFRSSKFASLTFDEAAAGGLAAHFRSPDE